MTPELQALVEDPQLAPMWAAVHDRLCAGTDPADVVTLTCDPLPRGGLAMLRSTVDDPRRTSTAVKLRDDGRTVVPVRRLVQALGVDPGDLLVAAVEAVGRRVQDRSAAASEGREARADALAHARLRFAATPAVADAFAAAGVRADVERFVRDVDLVAWCVDRLPCDPATSRQRFAHDATLAVDGTGDAHALDGVLGDRVLLGAAQLLGRDVPERPAEVRRLWGLAGAHPDEVSTTVLTRGLRVDGADLIDRRLADAAAADAPVALTWWDLERHAPKFAPGMHVVVVENPSVVADVLLRGLACGPLVCTAGQLTAVDDLLLQLLVNAGAQLTYVGDRDEVGTAIANRVVRWYGADVAEVPGVVYEEDAVVLEWLRERRPNSGEGLVALSPESDVTGGSR